MQHLTVEELARLVDEGPSPAEDAHLATCPACCAELRALREQTAALAALPTLRAPANGWERLGRDLEADSAAARPARRATARGALRRAAAVLAVFLAGGAAGLAVGRGASPPAEPVPANPFAADARLPAAEAAARELRAAEAAYVTALARYTEATGATTGADPLTRLVALEGILLTAGAALEQAPADPLINGYYLSAAGQREAVLRQIAHEPAQDDWF
jgi:anti-sigma factor RsiW